MPRYTLYVPSDATASTFILDVSDDEIVQGVIESVAQSVVGRELGDERPIGFRVSVSVCKVTSP